MRMIARHLAKDMLGQEANVKGALLDTLVTTRQEQVVPRVIIADKRIAVCLGENRYNLYVHRLWGRVPDCGRGHRRNVVSGLVIEFILPKCGKAWHSSRSVAD